MSYRCCLLVILVMHFLTAPVFRAIVFSSSRLPLSALTLSLHPMDLLFVSCSFWLQCAGLGLFSFPVCRFPLYSCLTFPEPVSLPSLSNSLMPECCFLKCSLESDAMVGWEETASFCRTKWSLSGLWNFFFCKFY